MAAQNNVYRVAARMAGAQGQDIINVWHVVLANYVTGNDNDVAQELVDTISAAYLALKPAASDDQASVDMSVQNVTTGAVQGTFQWTSPFVGQLTGDNLPQQDSLFAFFRTGVSRRIGRKFLGIVTEASQATGTLIPSIATTMATFLAQFIGTFVGSTTGNTYLFGVWNPNKLPVFLAFTEAIFNTLIMTQRRRRFGIGS